MKRWFFLFLLLQAALSPAFSLDRQAFTVTRYQLEVEIDRATHVMAVTGRLRLRNDSRSPQKFVTLQVSSSLAWNGIAMDDQPLEWIGDNYVSDIDHTGSLSEAIATLPKEVAPGANITVDLQYGGTITRDATRLTRLGTPDDVAGRNDWDQISESFTAVRGLGYVAWYPVALDAASLSDGNSVLDAIARWKSRHQSSTFEAQVTSKAPASQPLLRIATNAPESDCGRVESSPRPDAANRAHTVCRNLQLEGLGETVPTLAIADYAELKRPTVDLMYTPDRKALAQDCAVAAEANDSFLHDWLGDANQTARVIELSDPNANPYHSGAVLFTPLRQAQTANLQLLLVPAQVAARFYSPRPWIQDGLERFLQAMSIESRVGRKAALQFLDEYREPLVRAEAEAHPRGDGSSRNFSGGEANNTLLNTSDQLYLRGKGSFVFWMLRDMVKDEVLQRTLGEYRPIADKDASYLQRLLQKNSKRDLEWFFDDWVYRDRGLPELHVVSAYVRALLSEGYHSFMTTATIENRGQAGTEVPVLVETPSGDKVVRVLVKAGQQGVGRIELPIAPRQIKVNDGSVPEANLGNNTYHLPPSQQP